MNLLLIEFQMRLKFPFVPAKWIQERAHVIWMSAFIISFAVYFWSAYNELAEFIILCLWGPFLIISKEWYFSLLLEFPRLLFDHIRWSYMRTVLCISLKGEKIYVFWSSEHVEIYQKDFVSWFQSKYEIFASVALLVFYSSYIKTICHKNSRCEHAHQC